jgi:hypothetical protein
MIKDQPASTEALIIPADDDELKLFGRGCNKNVLLHSPALKQLRLKQVSVLSQAECIVTDVPRKEGSDNQLEQVMAGAFVCDYMRKRLHTGHCV